jgi:hypothetical protein
MSMMTRMTRYSLLAVTLLLIRLASAQTSAPVHNHGPDNFIDGSVHPELIPDSAAYRLYFLSVSEMPNPSEEEKARQTSHLLKIQLHDDDLHPLVGALEDFKQQYNALIERYNREAAVIDASGGTPNIMSFLIQRDALVQSTRNALKQTLSAEGMTKLDAHIQNEKRHMKIGAKEAQ